MPKNDWPYVSKDWIYDQIPGPPHPTGKSAEDWQEENYPFYLAYKSSVGLNRKRTGLYSGRATKVKSPSSNNFYLISAYHWTPVRSIEFYDAENLRGEKIRYEPILNSPEDDIAIRRIKKEKVGDYVELAEKVEKGEKIYIAGNNTVFHQEQSEEEPILSYIPGSLKNEMWIWQMPIKGEITKKEKSSIRLSSSPEEEGYYPMLDGHSGSAIMNDQGKAIGFIWGGSEKDFKTKTTPERLRMLLKGADQISKEKVKNTLKEKFKQLPIVIQKADHPALEIANNMERFNKEEMVNISDTVQFWLSVDKFAPQNLIFPWDFRDVYYSRVRDKFGEEYLPEPTIENFLKRFSEETRPPSKRNVAI